MTAPRLTPFSDSAILRCPRCRHDFDHLHHERVEVFERREDAEFINKTAVAGKFTSCGYRPNEGSGNPSSRRNGILIHFYCESCGDGLVLAIAQHKGSTVLSWAIRPPSACWLERERAILEFLT
jgi:hypothetical protein